MTTTPESSADRNRQSVADAMRHDMVTALKALDNVADSDFDRLTKLAARVAGTPIAVVALLDDERLWLYSRHGLRLEEAPAGRSIPPIVAGFIRVRLTNGITGCSRIASFSTASR